MNLAVQQDTEADAAHSPRVRHLLAAARAAFIAHGFAGVSIDALARDAGVSKETIYRHFADKEALFRAALEEMGSEFASRTEAMQHATVGPDGGGNGAGSLAPLARAVLDSSVSGGLLSPLRVAAGVAGVMPDFAADLQRLQWSRMETVRRALERHAQGRGVTAPVPLELALDFGSLAVGGPALLIGFHHPTETERAEISQRVAALFSDGVLHAPALRGEPESVAAPHEPTAPPAAPVPAHIRTLLDVAARHFLERGYEGAGLLDIGAEARVGRGTLYRHFTSKAGLFAAVLRDLAAQLAAVARPPSLAPYAPETAQDSLSAFSAAAIRTLASPLSLALHRAAISVAPRDPALAREVHDTVRAPWIAPLADWLATLPASEPEPNPDPNNASDPKSAPGSAPLAQPRWLASSLLVLALQGNRLFATGRGLPENEIPARARRVAILFLHGFAATLEPTNAH